MGEIRGTAYHVRGGPIPGVEVFFSNLKETTDSGGNYRMRDVPNITTNIIFKKEGFELFSKLITTDLTTHGIMVVNATLTPIAPPEEFPKTITRGPYSFTARNEFEETQLNDFLGIDPPGDDLNTYLSKRDPAGLQQWKDYWFGIFGPLGRSDLLGFIDNKFEEYKAKIEVPLIQKLLDLIPKPIINIFTFIKGLSQANINTVLTDLLKLPDGETRIEEIGMKAFNELVKEAPEYEVLRKSPKGSVSIAIILGLAITILGIGTTVGWLRKEQPEPSGMAVWALIEAEEWEAADKANEQYRIFIEKMNTWLPVVFSWFNPFLAAFLGANRDSQLVQADAYQTIIDGKLAVKKGTLIIRPTPEDAKVSVEKEFPTTGVFSKELPIGTYSWTVSKFGFVSKTGVNEVKEDEVTEFNVTIEEEIPEEIPEIPPEEVLGKLTISAIDSIGSSEGIIIEIAGQPEITIAGTYDLSPGSYSVKASKPGFISQIKIAYVSEQKDTVVSFILEEIEKPEELPLKATIQIISEPTNSDIYIDGAYTWTKTPYTTVLDAGTYIIRIQTDGYFPQEASVTIGEGDEIIVPFVLEEIPEPEKPAVEYLPQTSYYPEYVALTYYTPAVETTPYSQVSLPNYPLLDVPAFRIAPKPSVPATIEKEILINIETTDLKPWKGRIFSIAWLDLSMPEAEPQVIVDEDEQGILKEFMQIFETGLFTKILGFKIIFDYRYIFNKLMLYRMQSKAFYYAELKDVKQLLDQVKEAFVYFPDKTGTLDDYGKELLGIGKYGTQETLLRRYIAGDIPYVEKFQLQQIQVTQGLYDLFRFSSAGSSISLIEASQSTILNEAIPQHSPIPQSTQIKKCPNCLANNPITAKVCEICGQAF